MKNHLQNENSLYLIQHSENPVDWYPWCEEAFNKALKEDKPIFLSIGYSTCHWCHVMERESFEDQEIANLMNEYFVSIKVDREERPYIDNIYMKVCQMLTGSGGWPMTIIMTPDKKPFFAGTYFPKRNQFQRIGLMELIPQIIDLWNNKRDEVLNYTKEISSAIINDSTTLNEIELDESIFDKAFNEFVKRFDNNFGGFGSAPKFPTPHNLYFLLRYWNRRKNPLALKMVKKTLIEMRKGGIYDQIGFGFHRYSTDNEWLVPHFEKMLYDQALLSIAYTEAFQITHEDIFQISSEEILSYILRDMTSPEGAFYTAEDADSDKKEGKFYLWTKEEIQNILTKSENEFLINVMDVKEAGNWMDQSAGSNNGTNILNLSKSNYNLSNDLIKQIEPIRKKLFNYRETRTHPFKDDKILTDWNGLVISALARASQAFDNELYCKTAEISADFIIKNLIDKDGRIFHSYKNRVSIYTATADDYAYFICALIDLYEATFKSIYLKKTIQLSEYFIKHYWDSINGGFFFTSDDSELIIARQKEIYDGAVPSANSVSILNLLKLYKYTGNSIYENFAFKIIKAFSNQINKSPTAYTQALTGLDFAFGDSYEIVIAGEKGTKNSADIIREFRTIFLPNKIIIFKSPDDNEILDIAPFITNQNPIDNKTTLFLCQNYNCNLPLNEMGQIKVAISRLLGHHF